MSKMTEEEIRKIVKEEIANAFESAATDALGFFRTDMTTAKGLCEAMIRFAKELTNQQIERKEGNNTMTLGDNIEATIEDSKLVIVVDLSGRGSPSASGKTTLLGSTRGEKPIVGSDGQIVFVNLNIYKKGRH